MVSLARAIGNPSRTAMLLELFDRPGASLAELAAAASIASSTASEHLDVLEDAGLVRRARNGRGTAVRLAGEEAARLVEQLLAFDLPAEVTGGSTKIARLRRGRTCYDHLAGRLGVGVADLLVAVGAFDSDLHPTAIAAPWLANNFDVDLGALAAAPGTRPLVRPCLDWTERRHHIAGLVGTEVLNSFLRHGWIESNDRDRSVQTTRTGVAVLSHIGLAIIE
jgi:DNA-binding transcriptional ArsR family regulator